MMGSVARNRYEKKNEENNETAEKENHVASLPNKRLQGVKFHETRILPDAENDQRPNEARKYLKEMGKKRHAAFVLRGRRGRVRNRPICHGFVFPASTYSLACDGQERRRLRGFCAQ